MSGAIGQYEVLRRIAAGGMGEVFLALQQGIEGFSREVVIKKMHPGLAQDPERVRMFLQEARVAALLDHPNIVQIFELGRQGASYFIVMEYVDGLSLSRLMHGVGGPLPIDVALQIACDVAEGLQFAHRLTVNRASMNLVHRDVSPSNILLSTGGAVKVADFGIAKVRGSIEDRGRVVGKHHYLSPEQALGQSVDRRSDIFSLGLVLYEMTTGRRAYAMADADVLAAAAHCAITPPAAFLPSYPRDLERVLLRALEPDPDRRFSQCHELQTELMELAHRYRLPPNRLGEYLQRQITQQSAPTRTDRNDGERERSTLVLDHFHKGPRPDDVTTDVLDPFHKGASRVLEGDDASFVAQDETTQVETPRKRATAAAPPKDVPPVYPEVEETTQVDASPVDAPASPVDAPASVDTSVGAALFDLENELTEILGRPGAGAAPPPDPLELHLGEDLSDVEPAMLPQRTSATRRLAPYSILAVGVLLLLLIVWLVVIW